MTALYNVLLVVLIICCAVALVAFMKAHNDRKYGR